MVCSVRKSYLWVLALARPDIKVDCYTRHEPSIPSRAMKRV